MTYGLAHTYAPSEYRGYRGDAEQGVVEIKGPPEQVLPVKMAALIAATLASRIHQEGAHLLRVRVWADTSPTFYTLYKVEVTLTERALLGQGMAAQASPFAWGVLLSVLAVLGLTALAAWQVSHIDWGETVEGVGFSVLALVAGAVVIFLILGGKKRKGESR